MSKLKTRIVQLERENEKLRALAHEDPLTKLPNRRAFEEAKKHELSHAHRHGIPMCYATCDIDRFKLVNDSFGHSVGDIILVRMAELLKHHCRESDFLARLGGEEFGILLPHTDIAGARLFIERLRETVEAELKVHVGSNTVHCTASFGVGELHQHQSMEDLVHQVDLALYRAKHAGRNRVMMA